MLLIRVSLCTDQFIPEHEDVDDGLPPVQLTDKWDGPRTYAEDFYAGGDMPPMLASHRTPSHLTPGGTPSAVEDVEFITPGVLTPESPPAKTEAFELEHDAPGMTAVEAPTFSMPMEPVEEAEEVGFTEGNELDESAIDDLYTDLREEPLPEATSILPPTPNIPGFAHFATSSDGRASQVLPQGHLDWNYPPAFVSGRPATAPGHLKTLSDVAAASASLIPDVGAHSNAEPEILVISDDEEELDAIGPLPLGTSDLKNLANASYDNDAESRNNDGEVSESLPREFSTEIADMFKDGRLNADGK